MERKTESEHEGIEPYLVLSSPEPPVKTRMYHYCRHMMLPQYGHMSEQERQSRKRFGTLKGGSRDMPTMAGDATHRGAVGIAQI